MNLKNREEMRASTETFLRHGPSQDAPTCKRPPDSGDRPDCPVSEPVVDETVLNTIQTWDRYCAFAIKVDNAEGVVLPEALDAALLKIIDDVLNEHPAMGCRWAKGLYFCALKDADLASAELFARQFQNRLNSLRPETVTIGIAAFPQLKFDRGQSLVNTCKALDHAAFFGPGSVVCFDAVSMNISGDKYYHAGDLELAATEYRTGLELNPHDANIHNSLGICHAKLGDLNAAKKVFERVLEIEPTESMAIYNLGMVAVLQGDQDRALNRFHEAYVQNRENYEIPFQIGRVLTDLSDWQAALDYLEAAIALNERHWQLFHLKGTCLAKMGDTANAIKAYSRSVKINPSNADGLSALGCLYDHRNENPEICKAFFQQSIQLNPQNGLFHMRLGCWYRKQDQSEQAMEAFQQATALGYDASSEIAALTKAGDDAEDQAARYA